MVGNAMVCVSCVFLCLLKHQVWAETVELHGAGEKDLGAFTDFSASRDCGDYTNGGLIHQNPDSTTAQECREECAAMKGCKYATSFYNTLTHCSLFSKCTLSTAAHIHMPASFKHECAIDPNYRYFVNGYVGCGLAMGCYPSQNRCHCACLANGHLLGGHYNTDLVTNVLPGFNKDYK